LALHASFTNRRAPSFKHFADEKGLQGQQPCGGFFKTQTEIKGEIKMTVGELKNKLRELDENLPVYVFFENDDAVHHIGEVKEECIQTSEDGDESVLVIIEIS
jgi:hypothetical protein